MILTACQNDQLIQYQLFEIFTYIYNDRYNSIFHASEIMDLSSVIVASIEVNDFTNEFSKLNLWPCSPLLREFVFHYICFLLAGLYVDQVYELQCLTFRYTLQYLIKRNLVVRVNLTERTFDVHG